MRIGRIEDAREILKQAKNKLSERNTHVKIADKYGWYTLEEYGVKILLMVLMRWPSLGKQNHALSNAEKRARTKSHMTKTILNQAKSCWMIFFASAIQKLSDSILTLDTVTHSQRRRVAPLGFGLDPNRTQDSTIPNLRCVSTVSTRVTSPPCAPSSFNKEQAECQCQRQPSLIQRQTRKASRQDEQLHVQDDSVSIASEFKQCKAEFKEKHFKNVNVKGRLTKHVDFWKNVLNVSDTDSNIIFSGYIVAFFSISRFQVV